MKKTLFILSFSLLVIANISFAATTTPKTDYDYVPLAPLPNLTGGDSNVVKADVGAYILNMYTLIIALSSVLAVFMIVYGGLKYMTTDAFEGKKEGKAIIVHTLWGLALIIASYIILYTIDPDLLKVNQIIKK